MTPLLNILIVDDEFAIRDSLKLFLEDYDFVVKTAESGEEALQKAKDNMFQLAIVDLRLPGISGERLILKLKSMQPDIQFLIHTGSTEFKLSPALKQAGIQNEQILIKPISNLKTLVEKINQLTT